MKTARHVYRGGGGGGASDHFAFSWTLSSVCQNFTQGCINACVCMHTHTHTHTCACVQYVCAFIHSLSAHLFIFPFFKLYVDQVRRQIESVRSITMQVATTLCKRLITVAVYRLEQSKKKTVFVLTEWCAI